MRQLTALRQPFQPFKINRILVGGGDAEGFFTSRFAGLKKIHVQLSGHLDFLARLASNF